MIGKKVYPDGPIPCKVFICGEGPGKVESETGKPFQGASGTDLDYVFLQRAAGVRRQDVRVGNVVLYRTDENDRDPTAEEIKRDEAELESEVWLCNPEVIVAVGRIAARWFMQTDDIDMEKLSGIPIICPRYPNTTLLISIHPAAGLYQPERNYHQIYWAFTQLGRLLRGEIAARPLDFRVPDHYYSNADPSAPLFGPDAPHELAVDTEGSVAQPWGLSYSSMPYTASVLRGTEESPARQSVREVFRNAHIIGHNILHDAPVLDALGTPIDLSNAEDSMLEAYLLPHLPRRLKALSYKLLGETQDEYEDIIKEPEERIAKEYLQTVLSNHCIQCNGVGTVTVPYRRQANKYRQVPCESCHGDGTRWPLPVPDLVFDSSGAAKLTRPISIGRRVRRILERGSGYREGWSQIDDKLRAPVEDHLGKLRDVTLDDVPLEKAVHYSAADADCTLRVHRVLQQMLQQEGLTRVYEIDKGILPIIDRMQRTGILIDVEHFRRLHTQFRAEIEASHNRIAELAGRRINPASPLQVAALIYDQLNIPTIRGQRSTDEKTLEALKMKRRSDNTLRELVEQITNARELEKMDGTYVLPLLASRDSHDRIHTRFLLHVVPTGRISSRDPNLQAVPTRTERGRTIRRGFIPRSGCRLVSVDLDQIELRVTAHLSQDENMLDIFTTGKDIHRATAALIYAKSLEEVSVQERMLAKTINFLILYGGGPGKLYSELTLLGIQVTKDECVGFINDWYRAYPSVRAFIERCHQFARQNGYCEDMFGGRRPMYSIYSCVERLREETMKWAVNTPVQGTAARITKLWCKRVWDNVLPTYWSKGIYCEVLLPIHDELIMEVESNYADKLIQQVVAEAGDSIELSVPIKAKGTHALSWDALK